MSQAEMHVTCTEQETAGTYTGILYVTLSYNMKTTCVWYSKYMTAVH